MKGPLLNPLLTGAAVRFMSEAPAAGMKIAPILNTPSASAQYYVFDNGNFTNVPLDIQRAPSSAFKRLKSKLSSDTFIARDYGIEEPMDKAELAMYASFFAADQSAMQRAINVILVNHEIRVRNIARAVTQTSSPTVKWNAASATTIIADIQAGKAVIRSQIGVEPNLLTLPYDVFNALIQSAELRAYFNYTQGGLITMENLQQLFRVKEIVVSGTIINGANEGQASALADIWTDEAFLSYSQASSDVKALNFARTFNWTGVGGSGPSGVSVYTYDEEPIDSRIVRARQFTDEKVVASGAGYYFSNVLA